MAIQITGDARADEVLTDNPFALLVGMMLDQQYPMEHAFRGPAKVLDRFGTLDPAAIAAADPDGVQGAVLDPARDPPVPGLDGRAAPDAGSDRGRAVRRSRRADLDRGVVGGRPAEAGDGAARVRQAEGADLHRPGGQAARRTPRRVAGRRSATTRWTATARWRTSWTPHRCRRCATSSRRRSGRRRRPRPPAEPDAVRRGDPPLRGSDHVRGRMTSAALDHTGPRRAHVSLTRGVRVLDRA